MRPVSWCTLFLVWSLPLLLFSLCKSIVNGMTKKRKNHFGFRTFLCFQLCDSWLNCEVILDICCIKPSKLSLFCPISSCKLLCLKFARLIFWSCWQFRFAPPWFSSCTSMGCAKDRIVPLLSPLSPNSFLVGIYLSNLYNSKSIYYIKKVI